MQNNNIFRFFIQFRSVEVFYTYWFRLCFWKFKYKSFFTLLKLNWSQMIKFVFYNRKSNLVKYVSYYTLNIVVLTNFLKFVFKASRKLWSDIILVNTSFCFENLICILIVNFLIFYAYITHDICKYKFVFIFFLQ